MHNRVSNDEFRPDPGPIFQIVRIWLQTLQYTVYKFCTNFFQQEIIFYTKMTFSTEL
jgi:hypothetical protein